MCGIYVHFSDNYPLKDLEIEKLKDGLNKRGPDNFGFFGNKTSISDISKSMNVADGKYFGSGFLACLSSMKSSLSLCILS